MRRRGRDRDALTFSRSLNERESIFPQYTDSQSSVDQMFSSFIWFSFLLSNGRMSGALRAEISLKVCRRNGCSSPSGTCFICVPRPRQNFSQFFMHNTRNRNWTNSGFIFGLKVLFHVIFSSLACSAKIVTQSSSSDLPTN